MTSDDRFPAQRPNREDVTSQLLSATQQLARDIGNMRAQLASIETRVSAWPGVEKEIEKVDRESLSRHEALEKRVRDVEDKLTAERTRSGIIFAMLGVVGTMSLTALITAIAKLVMHS